MNPRFFFGISQCRTHQRDCVLMTFFSFKLSFRWLYKHLSWWWTAIGNGWSTNSAGSLFQICNWPSKWDEFLLWLRGCINININFNINIIITNNWVATLPWIHLFTFFMHSLVFILLNIFFDNCFFFDVIK